MRTTRAKSRRARNVGITLALVPGFLYGAAWFVLGGDAGRNWWASLVVRALGLLLAGVACNCAWCIVRDTKVWRAFLGYVACLAAVVMLLWVALAS
jgi:hypothetical protein